MKEPQVNLRFCLLSGLGTAWELDENQATGFNSKGPRYYGPISRTFNLLTEVFVGNKLINYTSVIKDTIGSYNSTSGYYDDGSCLHSLQINESDFGMVWAHHPLVAKNLKPLPPYLSDHIYMLSRYEISNETYAADFVKAFGDVFSLEIWFVFACFIFIFWALVKLHIKFVSRGTIRDDALYEVLTQLFQVESVDYSPHSLKMVALFSSLLSFHIFNYFTLSMKTDIVVIPEPKVVRSYDDLLAMPHIKIMFPRLIDNIERFESAALGTKERMLWQKSLKEVNYDKSQLMLKIGGTDIIATLTSIEDVILDPKVFTLGLVSELYMRATRELACILKSCVIYRRWLEDPAAHEMDFYTWLSKDPKDSGYIISWSYSASFKSPVLNEIYARASWAFSLGIREMILLDLNQVPTNAFQIQNQAEGDIYRSCLDYRENMSNVKFAPFAPIQFKTLGYSYVLLLLAASTCLTCENFKQLSHRRTLKLKKVKGRTKRRVPNFNQLDTIYPKTFLMVNAGKSIQLRRQGVDK